MRSTISNLTREFVDRHTRTMLPVVHPITPAPVQNSAWARVADSIERTFAFNNPELRNRFVTELLVYEETTGQRAKISIYNGSVTVSMQLDYTVPSETDKEYMKYAELLDRDTRS